jgi:hypothetical protein
MTYDGMVKGFSHGAWEFRYETAKLLGIRTFVMEQRVRNGTPGPKQLLFTLIKI